MSVLGMRSIRLPLAALGLMLLANSAQARSVPHFCTTKIIQVGEKDPQLGNVLTQYKPDQHAIQIDACFASNLLDFAGANFAFSVFDTHGVFVGGGTYAGTVGQGPIPGASPNPEFMARGEDLIHLQPGFDGTKARWVLVELRWSNKGSDVPSGQTWSCSNPGSAALQTCSSRFIWEIPKPKRKMRHG